MLKFKSDHIDQIAILELGFRPFFLLALLGAVVLGALWSAIYSFGLPLLSTDYSFISWHAHEMIFAYAFAVLGGFLLTAIRNRTHVQTINGWPLLLLAILWLIGRILPFISIIPLWYLAIHELVFMALILFFAILPLLQTNSSYEYRYEMPVFIALLVLMFANLLFHLGLSGMAEIGTQVGLYLGLYTFVGLILVMGRRVIPGFIEHAIGGGFQARNNHWLDWASRGAFVLFLLAELTALNSGNASAAFISAVLALILFVLHVYRLYGWHHRSLWLHPLLWSLYLAYAWIAFGFLLRFLNLLLDINPWSVVHAFTYGGIGLITASMMARIILGHTGRSVAAPPPTLGIWLGVLVVGAFVRVVMVNIWPAEYQVWILAAQVLWLAGFIGLLMMFAPMLVRPGLEYSQSDAS